MGTDLGNMIRVFRESKDLSRKEFCKVVGISTSGLAYYEKGDREPSGKVLHKIREGFSLPNTFFTKESEGDIKGEQSMNTQLYEDHIKLQKREISRLETDIDQLQATLEKLDKKEPEEHVWNELNFHFMADVELHWDAFGLNIGRTITNVTNIEKQSEILGYSTSKLEQLWDVGVKHRTMDDHPINSILHPETIENINKIAMSLPAMFEMVKKIVGNYYIPSKLLYECKDGSFIGGISYNKIIWSEKKVRSKVEYIIETDFNQ